MKNKGFTLIELLAVVIILAVISLIAVPTILDVVSDARKSANRETVNGIIRAADLYYSDSLLDSNKKYNVNIYDIVELKNKRPENGKLYVDEDGNVAISVVIDNICYIKTYNTELQEKESEECDLGYEEIDDTQPTITFEITGDKGNNDWYVSDTYVKIKVEDDKGLDYFNWCSGVSCNPENKEIESEKQLLLLNGQNQVCVKAYDRKENESNLCTNIIKVDKNNPNIVLKEPINEVIYKTSNEIIDYFNIDKNGYSDISKTSCQIDSKNITNTKDLEEGDNIVECKVVKESGKETTASITIKVNNPNIILVKDLDENKQNLVLKPSIDSSKAVYTWYKDNKEVSNDKSYRVNSIGTYKLKIKIDEFEKTSTDLVISEYTLKNEKNIIVGKEDNKCILRRVRSDEIEEFTYSEKCELKTALNLVKNGYLEYKDNTNFEEFEYDPDEDVLYAMKEVKAYSNSLIPIDYNKTYHQSIEITSENQESFKHYAGLIEYDTDKFIIIPNNILFINNTLTYLTKDLKDGDTKVYLNDISNFRSTETTPYYQLGFIFWNYQDSTGYIYPELTYSRNISLGIYSYTSIDKENNVITLKEPWKYGTYEVGTKLSQSNSGNNYNYGLIGSENIPSDYTKYENTITGWANPSDGSDARFRYGTSYIKFLLLINYGNNNQNKVSFRNLVITEE